MQRTLTTVFLTDPHLQQIIYQIFCRFTGHCGKPFQRITDLVPGSTVQSAKIILSYFGISADQRRTIHSKISKNLREPFCHGRITICRGLILPDPFRIHSGIISQTHRTCRFNQVIQLFDLKILTELFCIKRRTAEQIPECINPAVPVCQPFLIIAQHRSRLCHGYRQTASECDRDSKAACQFIHQRRIRRCIRNSDRALIERQFLCKYSSDHCFGFIHRTVCRNNLRHRKRLFRFMQQFAE